MTTTKSSAARSVLISGASSGIGRATALRLAADGWLVLAGVRRLTDTPHPAPGSTGSIRGVQVDVTDPGSVEGAVGQVSNLLPGAPLTALVNNAGIGVIAPMETVAYGGPLTSSKWAVASIAEAFRLELRSRSIAVTIVEPGSIRTDAIDKVRAAATETATATATATANSISQHDPALADRFRRAVHVAVQEERDGSAPDVVATAIAGALDVSRPRTRILVGRHARLMAAAAAVLPDRALDSLRLRLFRQHP